MKNLLKTVLKYNAKLANSNFVIGNFGNVSMRNEHFCIIKPSGVDLAKTTFNEMSVININSKQLVSGGNPSTDTPTHLELYRNFDEIGAIVHTHSKFATVWAQAAEEINVIELRIRCSNDIKKSLYTLVKKHLNFFHCLIKNILK